jgi:predicted RNA-binding protein YlqC (UPF0109 family)
MKEIVEVIAKAIVDNPDEVVVTEREEGRNLVIELKVAQEDKTRVIGKGGRVADSIRSIVNATSTKENKRVYVKIV